MPKVAYENTRLQLKIAAPVVGTTGFTPEQIQELTELREKGFWGLDCSELY